jgi:hypothetical protein
MSRRIWTATFLLGIFYIIAWLITGNWFDPAARANDLRWFVWQTVFCLLGIFFWAVFFSQFILPLQTVRQRFQAILRLGLHMVGLHGPAVFVEEGHVREYAGEEERTGPGLIWMDSASGGVLAHSNRITRVIGPGLHFTAKNETLLGTVNLRTQKQTIGPRGSSNPFATAPASDSEDDQMAFASIRAQAEETLAQTKDNIPIVPNITVIFKIKAQPAKGLAPGSRFGYDPESVRKAVLSKMVNAGNRQHTHEWNELPAYIAADIWREMLRKYYFNELFQPFQFRTELEMPEMPTAPAEDPAPAMKPRSALQEYIEDISHWLGTQFHILNEAFFSPRPDPLEPPATPPPAPPLQQQPDTVLNFIQKVVKLRLTQPLAPEIDEDGHPTGRWVESLEYRQMEERGIEVKAVIISNLQLPREIENRLISDWATNWLQNAQKRSAEITQYLQQEKQRIAHETGAEVGTRLARRINDSKQRIESQPTQRAKRARYALQVTLETLLRLLKESLTRREGLRNEIERLEEIRRDLQIADLEQEE